MAKETAPAIPNPVTTAQAQTTSNVDTAKAQAQLNNVNQVTPYGNLTYTSTTGANGIPSYTATETLSPAEQALLNTTQGTQQTLANTASTEAGKLQGMLNTPLDLSQSNLDNYTDTHFLDTFNQQQDRALSSLQSQLANQGINIGSTAYTNAMNDFNNQRSSALDDMLSKSQANAENAIVTQRQEPLNEIIGLASGSQVQAPSFNSTPQTGVAGTDVAGITQNAYNSAANQYQYQNSQTQSLLGGLFGLGANLIPYFAMSDERLKENVEKVGELPDDTNVYAFDYKPETGLPQNRQIGVMAQEVEKTHPGAVVTTSSGYKAVDYHRVLADAVTAHARKAA